MRFRTLLLLVLIFGCTQNQISTNKLLSFLPQNPSLVIRINDLDQLKTELKNNQFLQVLSQTDDYSKISERLEIINDFKPTSETVMGFYEVGKNNFDFVLVTKNIEGFKIPENTTNYTAETFEYDSQTVKKLTLNDDAFYQWQTNGHFIITSSQLLIENLIRTKFPIAVPSSLQQLYDSSLETNNSSVFFNFKNGKNMVQSLVGANTKIDTENFAEWSALDFSNENNDLYLKGVTIANDSTKSFLNLFKGTLPSVESVAEIAPKNSDALLSFRFGDFSIFANNQRTYLDRVKEADTLLNTIEEVGVIINANRKSVVLKSFGPGNLIDYLLKKSSKSSDYQGHEIQQLQESEFIVSHLNPLVKNFTSNYWTILDNYFVFSEQSETLQIIIANKTSGTTFNTSDGYLTARESLPNESSIFYATKKNGIADAFEDILNKDLKNQLDKIKLDDFNIAAQISVDGSLFHSQVIVKKIGQKRENQNVSPLLNVQLDNDLATDPQFVKNHRNGNYEIAVQDVDNNLYLINAQGKILWKKQLDGKIRGKIHQVDLYKNGRLQMAFCTNDRFMVLDRNGEVTKGIDKKFEGGNLNGLAVFDYENSRNYRMVVTQGRKIFMYNNDGTIVDGFTYTETESPIIQAPKHFRMGNNDYLVFQLENGSLKIRHRAGGNRISVNRNIDFSGNEVFLYNNKFSVTDKKGVLHQVDTKGKLAATNFNLGQNHGMMATSKSLVLMDENILNIKGKKVELELGIYTKPIIFYIYDKIYVSVTDLQNQKIYLFDSQAEAIPNFPVYGSSAIDLTDIDGDRKLELVAKDQDNSIILYGIN